MNSVIILLTSILLIVAIGCGDAAANLGKPYTATELVLAQNQDPSLYDSEWKGKRINVKGVVDSVDSRKIYLEAADSGISDNVALDDLTREERERLGLGEEVEYACTIGEYATGTINMEDCGPAEHGGAVSASSTGDSTGDTNPVVKYWSIPALLIASVLTVTAMARSNWRAWQPPIIAIMCLGVLAILNVAATAVFEYTTVNSALLTTLAAVSFPMICILGWIMLNPEQFPVISGATPETAPIPTTSTVQARPASTSVSPAGIMGVSDGGATAMGAVSSPVVAAGPSQTIAMQPGAAKSMAWLVVTKGPSEGKSLQLKEGNNTIGRSMENDLQIDDGSVSRAHAMLSVKDDQFTLVDLGSTGGTRIGEHRISGRRVGPGSTVIVGQTMFVLMNVDAFQGGPSSGATMIGSSSGSSLSLIVQSGPDAGKSFLLASEQNVIGRDPSAQVVLSDPTVSRRHAMLRVDVDRTAISDLGSQSGTRVDGEALQGVRISVGDHIVVGQSEFTLMKPEI